jgi:hypothetical protein
VTFDWDEHYGQLVTFTGWTWDYIDQQMTLPRLLALTRVWETCPPVPLSLIMISAALGIKPPKPTAEPAPATPEAPTQNDPAELADFMSLFSPN